MKNCELIILTNITLPMFHFKVTVYFQFEPKDYSDNALSRNNWSIVHELFSVDTIGD